MDAKQRMYFELSNRHIMRYGAYVLDTFWGMIPRQGTPFSREGIIFRLWRDGRRDPIVMTHKFDDILGFVCEIAAFEQWRVVASDAGRVTPPLEPVEYTPERTVEAEAA